MNCDKVGGSFGITFFVTTRQTDFHSLSSKTAVQGNFGHVQFRYVRYNTRQAMIL